MLHTFIVNWSGQPIPTEEMMVMRRVAVEMRTIFSATEVTFVHERCEGLVRFLKEGVFGSVGGLFFFGDFGAKNDQPNTVDFFIPRHALRTRRTADMLLIMQTLRREGDAYVSEGYPEVAKGAGKLKITVRAEH